MTWVKVARKKRGVAAHCFERPVSVGNESSTPPLESQAFLFWTLRVAFSLRACRRRPRWGLLPATLRRYVSLASILSPDYLMFVPLSNSEKRDRI